MPRYDVTDTDLPEAAFFQHYRETGTMLIWSGGTETAIYGDPSVNWRFRAWHDAHHAATGIGFTVEDEVQVARIQCAQLDSRLAAVVWQEIAGQALEFERTGKFLEDQTAWTIKQLTRKG